jgi:hypothetical protein
MRAARFYTDRLFSGVVLVVLAVYLSYSLTSFIGRLAEPPLDLVGLAGLQLETGIVGVALSASLAAMVAARHNRHSGRDILASSAISVKHRVLVQFVAVYVPVLVGWIIYVGATAASSGATGQLGFAILALGAGALALASSVAFGQVFGSWLNPAGAIPFAFIAAYIYSGFFAIFGDDYWWQWLGPAFGDSLAPRPKWTWLAGEYFWFGGVTAMLLAINMKLDSSPRRAPRRLVAIGLVGLTCGMLLLVITGEDASPDFTSFAQ